MAHHYESRRERAARRMKWIGLAVLAVFVALLVWFYTLGGERSVETIELPVPAERLAS